MSDDSGYVNQARYVAPGGSHVLFEPPDLCIGVYVGVVTPEETTAMFAELQRLSAGKKYVLTLVDVSRSDGFSAASRKAAAEGARGLCIRGTAIIGANFHMRMFTTLITKALNMINTASDQENPVRFFATDAEARGWFAERRAIISREGA